MKLVQKKQKIGWLTGNIIICYCFIKSLNIGFLLLIGIYFGESYDYLKNSMYIISVHLKWTLRESSTYILIGLLCIL